MNMYLRKTRVPRLFLTKHFYFCALFMPKRNGMLCFVDLPGAFLRVDINEEFHVQFEEAIAKSIAKLDPQFDITYVQEENCKQALYFSY